MDTEHVEVNRDCSEEGFSLIELLLVTGIIGILLATAIAQYSQMKERSFNARAISDLRNIMSAQEAQYADTESYVSDLSSLRGFDESSPSVLVLLGADGQYWSGSSYHPSGTRTYCYDSSNRDGIVEVDGIAQQCP